MIMTKICSYVTKPNLSPVTKPLTKYDQTVPQWPNHSTITTMTNLFTRDQTVYRWPNRSHLTKPYTCGQNHSSTTKPFTCDLTVHLWPKLLPMITASHLTKLFTHDQTIYLWPTRPHITKLFIGVPNPNPNPITMQDDLYIWANKEFRKHKLQALHEVLLQKRKYYNKMKGRAQTVYKQNERQRLHDLASSNPKSFWHEIRQIKGNKSKQCNVSLQAFYEHFSQVYSENSNFSLNHVEEFIENNPSSKVKSASKMWIRSL